MHPADMLARNLRLLMDKEGLSEAALQKRSGVSQKGINKILNGQSAPTITTLGKLAHAFRMDPWQLLVAVEEAALDREWRDLMRAYSSASPEGRELIRRVAGREAAR